ncbi:MAG: disulfide bond formation protein B [Gammaproteobacteria bacterium]|nr:disulfide bond formation protein B [Gammaproteobacteria bacterium]MDP2139968.1 disulfide bond formation protein B [Gammaproteobacteria bacterium]MDP2347788.1 disulfide bond formation protein B [Gammaproteobacteria bacterium]
MANLLAMIPGTRTMNLLIFVACTVIILIALYMEHVMMLQPCGLCITQRIFVILCGLVCLASAIHNPSPAAVRNYALGAASMCVAGAYFAGRQIWLQHLPEDQVPACGPGLTYIMDNFPLMDTLSFLLKGDGNCAEVSWRFLGIFSIAELAMMGFAALFSICIFQAVRKT